MTCCAFVNEAKILLGFSKPDSRKKFFTLHNSLMVSLSASIFSLLFVISFHHVNERERALHALFHGNKTQRKVEFCFAMLCPHSRLSQPNM